MRPIVALSLIAGTCLVAGDALAQRTRAVNPDDSVIAGDALHRVLELDAAGNTPEALRVLQQVLEDEGDRMLAVEDDPDLYRPVRDAVHALLRARPELLARYRAQEGPRADELLASGDLARVERTRLLTPAGFEAMLRLAQLDLEGGRFDAARLTLTQGESHPDRAGASGADAARLAAAIAARLGREDARAWAARWAADATLPAPEAPPPSDIPDLARPAQGVSDPAPRVDLGRLPASPLRSVRHTQGPDEVDPRTPAWVAPVGAGRYVYLADATSVRCFDAVTLSPVWTAQLGMNPRARRASPYDAFGNYVGAMAGANADLRFPAVGGGVVVTHTAGVDQAAPRGDRRIFAFDARTGAPLWDVDLETIDPRLAMSSVRGGGVVDADTVVFTLRESGVTVRVNRTHLVALDLFTGRPRWVRLLGTVGTNPWGRLTTRPDLTTIHQGVVYRGDEMGVIGAYEAASGRPLWVRTLPAPRQQDAIAFRPGLPIPGHEANQPVVADGSVFYVEPGRGAVVQLDAATGALRARREGASLGEPRYLLRAGQHLACVGATRVSFVPLDDMALGPVRLSPEFRGPAPIGRALVSEGFVILPLADGAAILDPARPTEPSRLSLPAAGMLLAMRASDAADAHLLAADAGALHTYVAWDQARALLERRVAQAPRDPGALLTYIELVDRAGKPEDLAPLVDRTLVLLDARANDPEARAARTQLTELLLSIVRRARKSWTPAESPAAARATPAEPAPIRDLPVLAGLLDRLARAADAPRDAARVLLEAAWFADVQSRPDRAVDAFQRILLDEALREVALDEEEFAGEDAGAIATRRLATLLRRTGPTAYVAFDEEARFAIEALPAGAPGDVLADLAARYPGASGTPDLWRRAAEAFGREGRADDARRAIGAGLRAGELARAMGRSDLEPVVGALASALLAQGDAPARRGGLYRQLRRLAADFPRLELGSSAGVTTPAQAADALRADLASRDWPALLGHGVGVERIIEGLDPLPTLFAHARGLATDMVVLAGLGRVALWGVDACTGELEPLWERESSASPAALMLTPDAAILHWPTSSGGTIERIGVDGRTAWRTRELGAVLRGAGTLPEADPIPTPLDGDVAPSDLLVSADLATIAVVRRTGACAVIDARTGETLWSTPLPMARVYEIAHAGEMIVIAGIRAPATGRIPESVVVCVHARTGEVRATLPPGELGDHPRWVRPLDDGDALLAAGEGLVRFSPRDGAVRWTAPGDIGRAAIAGWQVGQALFVLDADLRLRRGDAATGRFAADVLDARDRLTLPISAGVIDGRLVLAGAQGVMVYDEAGALVGADSLQSSRLEPAALGRDVLVTLELPPAGFSRDSGDLARLILLSSPTGKVVASERLRLYEPPASLSAIDGKVLIGLGSGTIVLDASPR